MKVFLLFFKYYLLQFVFFYYYSKKIYYSKALSSIKLRYSWIADVTVIIDLYHFLTLSWYILNVSIRDMELKTNYLEIESLKS